MKAISFLSSFFLSTDASSKIDLTKEKDGMYFVQISTANTRPKTIRIIKTSL